MTLPPRPLGPPGLPRLGALPPPGSGRPDATAALDELRVLVVRADETIDVLEERIELLVRACALASLTVPGVTVTVYRFEISGTTVNVMRYVAGKVVTDRPLAQAVQVTVFRFYEGVRVRDESHVALTKPVARPDLVAALRQALYLMHHFHADFVNEPVLAQIFPSPQTLRTGGGDVAGTDAMKAFQRQESRRKAHLEQVRILLAAVAPTLALVRRAHDAAVGLGGVQLNDLFSPQGRAIRMVALAAKSNPGAVGVLAEVLAAVAALEGHLAAEAEGAVLEAASIPVGQLHQTLRRHPLLKDLAI